MKLFNDLKKLYCSPDELEAGDYFYLRQITKMLT